MAAVGFTMKSAFFSVILAVFCELAAASSQHRAVLLDSVSAITLHKGKYTTGRRLSPIPQLRCIRGCISEAEPDVVQCKNTGSDGFNVQWKCEADLPDYVKFGTTEVVCEGYDSPDDPRVLEGSCGLEYSLKQVGRQPRTASRTGIVGRMAKWDLSQWIMLLVILYIAYSIYRVYFVNNGASQRTGQANSRGGGGWGPGGGGGGGPFPPGGGGGGGGGWGSGPHGGPGFKNAAYEDAGWMGNRGNGANRRRGWGNGWGFDGMTGLGLGYLLGQWQNRAPVGGYQQPQGGGWFNRGRQDLFGDRGYAGAERNDGGPRAESPPQTRQASAYASTRRR